MIPLEHITGEIPILCDNYSCPERGEYPRCYLRIYKECERYIAFKEWEKERWKKPKNFRD